MFEDNSNFIVVALANLMHLLLSAKLSNLIMEIFLIVIGNLRTVRSSFNRCAIYVPHLSFKSHYINKFNRLQIHTGIQVTGSPRFSLTGITPVLTTSNVIEAAGTVELSIIRNLEDIRLTASRCVAEARGMASTDIICNKRGLGNGISVKMSFRICKTILNYLISRPEALQMRFGTSFDGRHKVA